MNRDNSIWNFQDSGRDSKNLQVSSRPFYQSILGRKLRTQRHPPQFASHISYLALHSSHPQKKNEGQSSSGFYSNVYYCEVGYCDLFTLLREFKKLETTKLSAMPNSTIYWTSNHKVPCDIASISSLNYNFASLIHF